MSVILLRSRQNDDSQLTINIRGWNMKRISSIAFALLFVAFSAFAQDLPTFELGIGAGAVSYGIDCQFDNPDGLSVNLGDHLMVDWDNVDEYTTWSGSRSYPATSTPMGANTIFIVRLPLGERFAVDFSNRASFAFDGILHREDRYGSSDLVLTLVGATGIELELYPMEPGRGLWLGAFGGASVLNQPFVENYITQWGWSAGGTVGWRFSRNLALEINGLYFQTGIPSSVIEEVESLDESLSFSGSAQGWTVSGGLRFGL
jgi:hypothetical protein